MRRFFDGFVFVHFLGRRGDVGFHSLFHVSNLPSEPAEKIVARVAHHFSSLCGNCCVTSRFTGSYISMNRLTSPMLRWLWPKVRIASVAFRRSYPSIDS